MTDSRAQRLGLEPGSVIPHLDTHSDDRRRRKEPHPDEIAHSIAISLKRIANALTGAGPSILTAPINSYGEGLGDAIQGQMIRGQRGIDQYERGQS